MEADPKREYKIDEVRILEGWGDVDTGKPGGFILQWSSANYGVGCLTFRHDKETLGLVCETEYMSPEFVDAVLAKFREDLTFLRM